MVANPRVVAMARRALAESEKKGNVRFDATLDGTKVGGYLTCWTKNDDLTLFVGAGLHDAIRFDSDDAESLLATLAGERSNFEYADQHFRLRIEPSLIPGGLTMHYARESAGWKPVVVCVTDTEAKRAAKQARIARRPR